MKIKLLIISIAIVMCLSSAPAMADFDSGYSVVDRTTDYYTPGYGGGEFTLSTATLSTSAYSPLTKNIATQDYNNGAIIVTMTTSFQTFCVETDEYVFLPHMVEQTIINWDGTDSDAVYGGSDPSPEPDPLDPMTAYLYTQFATGVLSNYDYPTMGLMPGDDRDTDARQLQYAIWYIEQELGPGSLISGSKAEAWYKEAYDAVVTNQTWTGIGDVRVLNLWDNTEPTPLQDMLYLVPVPGAVLLGILGLGVAGIKLRKFA